MGSPLLPFHVLLSCESPHRALVSLMVTRQQVSCLPCHSHLGPREAPPASSHCLQGLLHLAGICNPGTATPIRRGARDLCVCAGAGLGHLMDRTGLLSPSSPEVALTVTGEAHIPS